jgi:dinuclear metal center YbgI/SA1388 family protein
MTTADAVAYLNSLLRISEIEDYPTAFNGLQVANSGSIQRVAAAVDASEASIRGAAAAACDMLLVHHGLFWDGNPRVTDRNYRRFKLLLDNDIAVYSAHLPLDLHETLGNNQLLARALGISVRGSFGNYKGSSVGLWGELDIHREALTARLDDLVGARIRLIPGGPELIRRIGIVTGGAGSMIGEAAQAGFDAFITGEGTHHTYFDAMENGINVYYAGHYATETFGVRALAEHLAEKFQLEWEFLDLPTQL